MKQLTTILTLLAVMCFGTIVAADQRFETTGGFCHFVTPEGFANNNDDNEVFFANCENSIRQTANGDGNGSTLVKVKYPSGAMPFYGEHTYSGADTGVDCVMVDSNNTTYATQDWDSTYSANVDDFNKFKRAFGSQEGDRKYREEFDFNDDGVINTLDLSIFRSQASGTIKYTISCRNGAQQ